MSWAIDVIIVTIIRNQTRGNQTRWNQTSGNQTRGNQIRGNQLRRKQWTNHTINQIKTIWRNYIKGGHTRRRNYTIKRYHSIIG